MFEPPLFPNGHTERARERIKRTWLTAKWGKPEAQLEGKEIDQSGTTEFEKFSPPSRAGIQDSLRLCVADTSLDFFLDHLPRAGHEHTVVDVLLSLWQLQLQTDLVRLPGEKGEGDTTTE